MLTLLTVMIGCSGETPPPPPPPVPEPMPEPAPAKAEAMTVDALAAAFDGNVGKDVTVKGFFANVVKQESPPQLTVPVFVDAEMKGAQALCIVTDMGQEAKFGEMGAGEELVVTGKLSAEKFFDNMKIEGCMLAPEMEGKAHKGKAKADGEGKSGKGGGGDEGKGGKGKKGG